jgi:hypothetical protein
MERGSDKHSPRMDEGLKSETRGLVQAGHDTHVEEWKLAEPAGEDQPDADRSGNGTLQGAVPDGMSETDVEQRSRLAAALGPGIFPAVRELLLEHVLDGNAPDDIVAEIRRLPAGREFQNPGDVWRTLHGGGHVEEHRF